MTVIDTKSEGVLIIEPKVFGDHLGCFKESCQVERYAELGINFPFVKDNHPRSQKGVLRGLQLQETRSQVKLGSCLSGFVFYVVVYGKPNADTFGHYVLKLTEVDHRHLWIAKGYAHGFCVLSDVADLQYKCSDLYFPEYEGATCEDHEVAIVLPIQQPDLFEKDQRLPFLAQIPGNGVV